MVVYTNEALKKAAPWWANNDEAYIQGEIELAVEETNDAFALSGVSHEIQCAGYEELERDEDGDEDEIEDYLDWLTDKMTTSSTRISDFREDYHADVVSMWVADGIDACGVGWLLQDHDDEGFSEWAAHVVDRSCQYKHTFSHELGHNMGLSHDSYVTDDEGVADYARGYTNHDGNQMSIMAYDDDCIDNNDWWDRLWNDCDRVPVFSGPDVYYNEYRMGDATEAHAARALEETGGLVAGFR